VHSGKKAPKWCDVIGTTFFRTLGGLEMQVHRYLKVLITS